MVYRSILSAALVAMFATGCAVSPFEGDVADSDDSVMFSGGSPYAETAFLIFCESVVYPGSGSGYQFIGNGTAESSLRSQAEFYGDFYYWSADVVIPEACWHADGHANLRVRSVHNSKWYGVYTFDDTVGDCLPETYPWTTNDWTSCAQNSTGYVTVCRDGTSWNGSSCS